MPRAMRKAAIEREAKITGGAVGARGGGGKRRRVGFAADEDEEEGEPATFEEAKAKGRILAKQTLGAKAVPDAARYMVGVVRGGNFPHTCTPIFIISAP